MDGKATFIARTSIPLLLPMAIGLWVAVALVLPGLVHVDSAICETMGMSLAAAVAIVLIVGIRHLRNLGVRIALSVLVGCALSAGAAAALQAQQQAVRDASAALYTFRIVEDAQAGDFGDSCIAEVGLENGMRVHVRVNLPEGHDLACWDVFTARCRIKSPSDAAAPYYWQKDLAGSVTIHSYTKGTAPDLLEAIAVVRADGLRALRSYTGDGAALLEALLLGDRSQLFASEIYGQVKTAGLGHIVAVSGSHLAVVVAFLALLLRRLRAPRLASILLEVMFVCCYVVLTGAPLSAIRSAIMACCGFASFFAGRRGFSLNALALCVLAMVGLDPFLGLSVSLALSSCATLGIIVFARYFAAWFSELSAGRFVVVGEVVGMTCAANLLTLPISISTFGQLPLVSPLANVLAAPLFTILCVGGSLALGAAIVLPVSAPIVLPPFISGAQGFCDMVGLCASLPCACVPATSSIFVLGAVDGCIAYVLWTLWPKPSATWGWSALMITAAALITFLFMSPAFHGDEVVMLDVGQGDAFILRSANQAMMIDTGNQDAAVLAGLARHDIRALDALVITHADDDHCGSLAAILDVVEVRRVCVARDLMTCDAPSCVQLRAVLRGCEVVEISCGDTITLGDFSAVEVSPDIYEDDGGNADSIVLDVRVDCNHDNTVDWTGLFCGDAEVEVLDHLVSEGRIGKVDLLKVGHHGSKVAVDDEVLSVLGPQVSLVSVGAGNRYGHPAQVTIEALERCGSRVLRTDTSGDVVCSLTAEQMSVRTIR